MPKGSWAPAIVTLTMNPAVDLSFLVDRLEAGAKLRGHQLRRDPGGGGVNVARAVRRLGGRALAIFPAGGPNGVRLQAMLKAERTAHLALPIVGDTREDITAQDASTDAQYRFVMQGPRLKASEYAETLRALETLTPRPRIVVASGSLPPGAPADSIAAWRASSGPGAGCSSSTPAGRRCDGRSTWASGWSSRTSRSWRSSAARSCLTSTVAPTPAARSSTQNALRWSLSLWAPRALCL